MRISLAGIDVNITFLRMVLLNNDPETLRRPRASFHLKAGPGYRRSLSRNHRTGAADQSQSLGRTLHPRSEERKIDTSKEP